LTSHSDRQHYASLIDDTVTSGARKEKACEEIGLSIRTLQRWQEQGEIIPDKRPTAKRPEPKNKLTEEEQQAILDISNQEEYANLGPSQIVPMLADSGQYIASESSFYRVLKANDQL
ncbi:IS3 family transposase, partial [Pseudoalteromonas citrea]